MTITAKQARFIDQIRAAANKDEAVDCLLGFAESMAREYLKNQGFLKKGGESVGMVYAIVAANALVNADKGEEE